MLQRLLLATLAAAGTLAPARAQTVLPVEQTPYHVPAFSNEYVTVLNVFGNNQLPDAHTFRIEHGKLRYVHTITVCKTFNCGFKPPTGATSPTATAEPIDQPAAAAQPAAAKPAAKPAPRKSRG